MRIIIIGGRKQPIPPVKGGAVENLVKMFYETNEEYGNETLQLMVFSCEDKNIESHMMKFNHTTFLFQEKDEKTNRLADSIHAAMHRLFQLDWVGKSRYMDRLAEKIKEQGLEFDAFLVENCIEAVLPLHRTFPDSKIYLHLHNDKLNSSVLNGKQIALACEKIITVSDYIKSCVDTIPLAADRSVTVMNSIQVNKFGNEEVRKKRKFLRRKYNITDDTVLVIYAGRIARTKGVLELVQAFKKVKAENVRLMVVGNSWYGNREEPDCYIRHLQKESKSLKDRIIFTGYVDYDNMPGYYGMADMAVIPSVWNEPAGLTILETMASRLPLITTATGGTPRIVEEYAVMLQVDRKFVLSMARSIDELAREPERRKAMAEAAYYHVQQYNPERYYKELTRVFHA